MNHADNNEDDDDTRSNVNVGLWPDDEGRQCTPLTMHTLQRSYVLVFIFAGLEVRPCISLSCVSPWPRGTGIPYCHGCGPKGNDSVSVGWPREFTNLGRMRHACKQ